jgi:hypothetical protein
MAHRLSIKIKPNLLRWIIYIYAKLLMQEKLRIRIGQMWQVWRSGDKELCGLLFHKSARILSQKIHRNQITSLDTKKKIVHRGQPLENGTYYIVIGYSCSEMLENVRVLYHKRYNYLRTIRDHKRIFTSAQGWIYRTLMPNTQTLQQNSFRECLNSTTTLP